MLPVFLLAGFLVGSNGAAGQSSTLQRPDDSEAAFFRRTDGTIQLLRESIGTMSPGELKAERWMQLAELYFQRASRVQLRDVKAFNEKYDQWFESKSTAPEPKLVRSSDVDAEHAAKIYASVLLNYPHAPRAPQARFYLAQTYLLLERTDEAEAAFEQLIATSPDCEYVAQAYEALAQIAFDRHDYEKAREYVEEARAAGYPMPGYLNYMRNIMDLEAPTTR